MRIVLDTNVFISGVFFGGQPGKILTAWRDGKVKLILSPDILEEYVEVLGRLQNLYPSVEVQPIISLVLAGSEIIPATQLEKPVSLDPDDDKFIACAVTGRVKIIVSGDKHLLEVAGHKGIRIVKPSEFVREFLTRK
jgi:putative PIN family toxin of toxin-antitoxin system